MVNQQDVIAGDVGPLAAKVLEYEKVFRRVAATAKKPGFSQADWSPLAELVAVRQKSNGWVCGVTLWDGRNISIC